VIRLCSGQSERRVSLHLIVLLQSEVVKQFQAQFRHKRQDMVSRESFKKLFGFDTAAGKESAFLPLEHKRPAVLVRLPMTISFAATIPPKMIRHAWLHRFTLSYRHGETLLAEGVDVSREILRR
jgi:hypothetical protein